MEMFLFCFVFGGQCDFYGGWGVVKCYLKVILSYTSISVTIFSARNPNMIRFVDM